MYERVIYDMRIVLYELSVPITIEERSSSEQELKKLIEKLDTDVRSRICSDFISLLIRQTLKGDVVFHRLKEARYLTLAYTLNCSSDSIFATTSFDGNLILHHIIMSNNIDLCKILEVNLFHFPRGLEVLNLHGNSPLHLALEADNINIYFVKLMVEKYPKSARFALIICIK
jgi:hypothetical protein